MKTATDSTTATRITVQVFATTNYRPADLMLRRTAEEGAPFDDVDVDIIDLWDRPGLAVAQGVLCNPTVIVSAGGREWDRVVGVRSPRRIRRAIDTARHHARSSNDADSKRVRSRLETLQAGPTN